jgi:ABC-type amino acid transport substrate-binding protein
MLLRAICLCLSLISLVACGEKKGQDAQKPLIVITSPDSPPFEFKDTARGGDQVIGFDMDVAHKLGEYLGRPVKIVEADFSSLIPSLHSGRADMAIAYLSATDERRKSVDFSESYYANKLALLVPESSSITSEKDLEGKKLGAQLGSTNEIIANQWSKSFSGLSVVSLNKVGDLVQELKSGRIEAVLAEDIVVKKVVAANPELKIVSLEVTGDPLSIAFPKGSPLVAPTNEALKKMKGDIQEFASKWLLE